MKKGDMSLQVVVVAALSLLVLIVLIAIFSGQMGKFSWTVKDCQGTLGGTCKAACVSYDETTQTRTSCDKDSSTATPLCCIPIDRTKQTS